MKKHHFIIIILFFFILLGATQPVYSETGSRLKELESQQVRIEQMKTFVASLFLMTKDSDRREIVESALNELLNKIDTAQKRTKEKIEALEKERRVEIMKTTKDWKELADAFLGEPTLDNFDYFCKRSKEIDGWETKEVLSNDRKKMITVNKKLYESFGWCIIYFEEKGYVFVEGDINHKIKLLPSDTDEERKYKIRYNEKIEELANNYDFYAFHVVSGEESKNPSLHIEKCIEAMNVNYFVGAPSKFSNPWMTHLCDEKSFLSLESPEKIISEIIKREEKHIATNQEKQELKDAIEKLRN